MDLLNKMNSFKVSRHVRIGIFYMSIDTVYAINRICLCMVVTYELSLGFLLYLFCYNIYMASWRLKLKFLYLSRS